MWPCHLIQFRIALRRNAANTTPCTSLGNRTCGGFILFGVDVSHRLAKAESVMRSPKLRRSSGFSCSMSAGATARITEPRAKGIVARVRWGDLGSALLQSRPVAARWYLVGVVAILRLRGQWSGQPPRSADNRLLPTRASPYRVAATTQPVDAFGDQRPSGVEEKWTFMPRPGSPSTVLEQVRVVSVRLSHRCAGRHSGVAVGGVPSFGGQSRRVPR